MPHAILRVLVLAIGGAVVADLLMPAAAAADDIRVLSSVGIQPVLEELAPRFEKATGHTVSVVFDLASALKARIDGGEPFDVAILTPPLIDDLHAKGIVGTTSTVAGTGLGLMIRKGAPRPDLSTVESFTRTLLEARSIAYASAGASGAAFTATVARLGIADAIRATAAAPDEITAHVMSGASDLAVLPISEILSIEGGELGGAFPAGVQSYVIMAAGVHVRTAGTAAAEFVMFLLSSENDAAMAAKGMERLR